MGTEQSGPGRRWREQLGIVDRLGQSSRVGGGVIGHGEDRRGLSGGAQGRSGRMRGRRGGGRAAEHGDAMAGCNGGGDVRVEWQVLGKKMARDGWSMSCDGEGKVEG